jgi:cytochrome c biogenesis protein CcmG/thiol:disulfide interchange protein DsbE
MLLTVALTLTLGLTASAGESTLADTLGPVKVGEAMPTFAGWTLDGKMLSLSRALQGEKNEVKAPVVVTFFATWCKPCDHGLPILDRVAREKNAKLLMIAYGQEADVVRPYLTGKGITSTCILDPYLKVAKRSGVDEALPRTLVLDENGVVRAIFTSEGTDFDIALAAAIDRARAPAPTAEPAKETAPSTTKEKRTPAKGQRAPRTTR